MASVLIVDDEPGIRTIIALSLDGEGFELRTAASGTEALIELRRHPPDVMILDLMMPGIGGFEVLETMAAERLAPKTRVMIASCRTAEDDRLRGLALGADEYLVKPFDADELVATLRQLLRLTPAKRRARRAAQLAPVVSLDRPTAGAAPGGRLSAGRR